MNEFYERKMLLRNQPELITMIMMRTGRSYEEIRGFLQLVDEAIEEVRHGPRLTVREAKVVATAGFGAGR